MSGTGETPSPKEGETLESKIKGPFGMEPVDPIVFIKTNDNPELRLAASKIPFFTEIEIKEPAPVKPKKRKYTEWIPGFKTDSVKNNDIENSKNKNSFGKVAVALVIFAIPISLIIFIVKIGLSLYK